MSKKLRDKIYSMSNSFLPLDMFYNDIENMSKYPSFSMELAFRDLEKISDFILDLQSQLAEKDKEIENITITHLDMLRYFIRHNSKQGIILSSDLEREIKEIEQGEKIWQTKNFNKDKISFAVEQLKKVKEFNIQQVFSSKPLDNFIGNQIKQLKGEVQE